MLNFVNKTKGAISIFLIIVLVPMLVLSAIFVDVSRINLAKAVIKSSGDLTLNTALTDYDAVLKDMYGLFATAQNATELYENLEEYYRNCLKGAGLADADAQDYAGQLISVIKEETGTDDLMNMNLIDFEVNRPSTANLANPAVLKAQIVDFMKYRGPIELGSGIFDVLNSMKDLQKQTEMVDNKNKFYTEQHAGMMEKLEKVWNELERYQYSDSLPNEHPLIFPKGDYFKTYNDALQDSKKQMKTVCEYLVNFVFLVDTNYSDPSVDGREYRIEYADVSGSDTVEGKITVYDGSKKEYELKKPPKKAEDKAKADKDDVLGLLQWARSAQKSLRNLKNNGEENYNILTKGNSNLSTNDKIRVVRACNLCTNYRNYVGNLVYASVEIYNIYNTEDLSELSGYYVKDVDGSLSLSTNASDGTSLTSYMSNYTKYAKANDSEYIGAYNTWMKRAHDYYNDTKPVIDNAREFVKNEGQNARRRAHSVYCFCDEKMGNLQRAVDTLTEVKNDLNNPESAYRKALKTWEDSAGKLPNDQMAQSDQQEIERLKKVLTVDKVDTLIRRLNDAKSSLSKIKDQADTFSWAGKKWREFIAVTDYTSNLNSNTMKNLIPADKQTEIKNVAGFKGTATKTKMRVKGDSYVEVYGEVDDSYKSITDSLQATIITTELTHEWPQTQYHIDLEKNQTQLYSWLHNNFYKESTANTKYASTRRTPDVNDYSAPYISNSTDVSSHKKDAENPQSGMENEAKEYNDKSVSERNTNPNRTIKSEFLPSKEANVDEKQVDPPSNDANSTLSSSSGAMGSFMNVLGDFTTDLRDNMYITAYVMNMFSWSTFEAEIASRNGNDVSAFTTWFEYDSSNDTYKRKSDFYTKYKNAEKMEKDARTLTLVPINPNANYLYGREIEYIIYGGDTGCVAKAYGTIYLIRFALNCIFAFTDAEINNITTAAATALFGTPPLTPLIPIAKIAFTLGFSLAESAYDLYQLKCGEAVPLVKDNKSWVMKPSSAAKAVAGEILEELVDYAIDEGFNQFNQMLEMTNEELKSYLDSNVNALSELASSAADKVTDQLKDAANEAVQEMVNACNDAYNKALEDSGFNAATTDLKTTCTKSVEDALDNWLKKQPGYGSSTDPVYQAKAKAVEYIKNNSSSYIGGYFDLLKEKANQPLNAATDALQAMGDKFNTLLDQLQTQVNNKIQSLASQAGNAISDAADKAEGEIKKAAAKGAEELKSKLKEQISSTFGNSPVKDQKTGNVVANLLSWRYSDYLKLFLMVELMAAPDKVLLRTADVIELNMQSIDKQFAYIETVEEHEESRFFGLWKYKVKENVVKENPEAYKLKNAYTYLEVKATVEVKPIMLNVPLFDSYVKDYMTNTEWYQLKYDGVLGY